MLFDIDEPEETNAKIFRSSETGTEQKIWLDGRSPIWQQVRHNHISAVAGQLDTALRDTAASKTSSVLKKGFDTMSMEELREVMINAPEWSEVAAQVRGHVSFVMHLMDAYDKLGIAQASDVEQCIVSGVDGGTWLGLRAEGTILRLRAGDGGSHLPNWQSHTAQRSNVAVFDIPSKPLFDGKKHTFEVYISTSLAQIALKIDGSFLQASCQFV